MKLGEQDFHFELKKDCKTVTTIQTEQKEQSSKDSEKVLAMLTNQTKTRTDQSKTFEDFSSNIKKT